MIWDGQAWTIANPGQTQVMLTNDATNLHSMPRETFEALIRNGQLHAESTPTPDHAQRIREILSHASVEDLQTATHCHAATGIHPEMDRRQ